MPLYTTAVSSSVAAEPVKIRIAQLDAIGNRQSLENDVTIPTNSNFVLYGPITVPEGTTMTVTGSANLKIIDINAT